MVEARRFTAHPSSSALVAPPPSPRRAGRDTAAAFTLVEVMISVALVLFLIVGVNQVFKTTSDTVGQGQILSQNIRDTRAAQAVFYGDLAGAAASPPMFIIASQRVAAFRNAVDQASDKDFDPAATGLTRDQQIRTRDLNDDGDESDPAPAGSPFAEEGSPAIYDYRNHRIDRLAFFGRDIYRRQTGSNGQYASTTLNATASNEAWIWYGHLRLANEPTPPNLPTYYQPGGPDFNTTNRNNGNSTAAQFALGRVVMLLRDPNTFPAATEDHIARAPAIPAPPAVAGANPKLSPLSWDSTRTDSYPEPVATDRFIWSSRYDLAATTIQQFQTDLTTVALDPSKSHWWQWFLYAVLGDSAAPAAWPPPVGGAPVDYRFRANRLFAKPLDSYKSSLLTPILLNGCGQFIVEFAGDYVTQDANSGAILTPIAPDGVVDFLVDGSIGATGKRIRWYGLPRDVAGAPNGGPDGVIQSTGAMLDVLPVRDVRGGTTTGAPFERNIDTELVKVPNYAGIGANGMAPEARYTCVWGPDVNLANDPLPKMLRITLVLEDATGRLAEGQQYEYVIKLPY